MKAAMISVVITTTALMSVLMVYAVSIHELRGSSGDVMTSSKSDEGLLTGEQFTETAKIDAPCPNYGDNCRRAPLGKFRRKRINSNYIIFKRKIRLSLR